MFFCMAAALLNILQMKLPLKSCIFIEDLLQSFIYICVVVPLFAIVCSQNKQIFNRFCAFVLFMHIYLHMLLHHMLSELIELFASDYTCFSFVCAVYLHMY